MRAVRLRADGHLRAGPRGAGECRRLPQREDAERERAAHEFEEPRGPRRRSPKLPPLVFEAQTCAKDALYVGVDVVRCRRNGLANAPFPGRSDGPAASCAASRGCAAPGRAFVLPAPHRVP